MRDVESAVWVTGVSAANRPQKLLRGRRLQVTPLPQRLLLRYYMILPTRCLSVAAKPFVKRFVLGFGPRLKRHAQTSVPQQVLLFRPRYILVQLMQAPTLAHTYTGGTLSR